MSDGVTTLQYKSSTVIGVGIAGVASLVLGVFLLIKVLPTRLALRKSLPQKVRTFVRLAMLIIFGTGLLVAVIPFASYKIVVKPESLTIDEFPNSKTFSKSEITAVAMLQAAQGARIRVVVANGGEYFINQSEIGADGFASIKTALEQLVEHPIGFDRIE